MVECFAVLMRDELSHLRAWPRHHVQVLALGSLQSLQGPPLMAIPLELLPSTLTNLSLLNAIIVENCSVAAVEGVDDSGAMGRFPLGMHCLQLKWCDWRTIRHGKPCVFGLSSLQAMMESIALCQYLTDLVLSIGWPNNDILDLTGSEDIKSHPGSEDIGQGGAWSLPFACLTKLHYLSRLELQLTDLPAFYPFRQLMQQLARISTLRKLRLCVAGSSLWSEADSISRSETICTDLGQASCTRISPHPLLQLTCLTHLHTLHLEPVTMSAARQIKESLCRGLPNCR